MINCKNFSNSQLATKYTAYGTVYTVYTVYSAKFEKFGWVGEILNSQLATELTIENDWRADFWEILLPASLRAGAPDWVAGFCV